MELNTLEKREMSRCLIYSEDFLEITTPKVVEIGKLFFKEKREEFKEILTQHSEQTISHLEKFSYSIENYFQAICTYAYTILRDIPEDLQNFIYLFESFVFTVWKISHRMIHVKTNSKMPPL